MEYNVDDIRALAERWLAGETTLAEETALRDWFAGTQERLPVDLQLLGLLFGQIAQASDERSRRKPFLRTEPVLIPLRRWMVAASGIAAAVLIAVTVFVAPEHAPQSDILCVVNGVKITDPGEIAAHTRYALKIVGDNLRKPGETLSSELGGDPAMARVGEMLNELTKTE